MEDKVAITIDLGATKVEVAAIYQGKIVKKIREETLKENIPHQLEEMVRKVANAPFGVAIGIPGQVRNGVIQNTPNLPLANCPLADLLRSRLNCPIVLENDVRLALLGEWKYGALRGVKNGILCYVGTGVGGALLLNGTPFTGSFGFAGEIGHMRFGAAGKICGCGGVNCLETESSGLSFERGVFSLKPLIRASVSLVNLLNPEKLIFGGGVMEHQPQFVDEIREAVMGEALSSSILSLKIEKAALSGEAPLLGGELLLLGEKSWNSVH